MNSIEEKKQAFGRLLTIMNDLRKLCPWDRKQTNISLRLLTIEEVYELSEAILNHQDNAIKEELGDVLLHMVFYAKIAEEKGSWDIADSINSLCEKLIHRHPHIYADIKVESEEEVKNNWEKLKLKEKKSSVLSGVPSSLPSIIKAFRIQQKTSQFGFDWKDGSEVFEKIYEEIHELKDAIDNGMSDNIEEEFGDLLFSIINYARFIKVDPDTALERTNKKFIARFQYVEKNASKPIQELSFDDMNKLWNEAKHKVVS